MAQPGWYPDPASPYALRWWDGQRWTNDARPLAGPPVLVVDPVGDLAKATGAGRTASVAVLFGALLYAGQFFFYSLVVHRYVDAFRRWFDAPVASDGTRPPLVLPTGFRALSLVSDVITLGLAGAGLLVAIWLYQAATFARRFGLPARHSPTWAVVGWIVPIVSFWFPYQSTVDLFPPGHPGRRTVGRWWALWVATTLSSLLVLVGAIFSVGLGLALAVVATVVAFAAAFAFREVVAEVDRLHAGLLGR